MNVWTVDIWYQKSTFDHTKFGILAHKFILECTVTAKVEYNVAHTLCYHLVGGSTRYRTTVKAGSSKLGRDLMIYTM